MTSDSSSRGPDHAFEAQQAIGPSLKRISEEPTARGFGGVALTIHTSGGDDGENDPREEAEIVEALTASGLDVRAEPTGVGWGGDSGALTVVLESLAAVGTYGGGAVLSWQAIKMSVNSLVSALRTIAGRSAHVHLSLGAMTYLCLADLHDLVGEEFEGVRLVHAGELNPALGSTLGYSGAGELYTVLLVNRRSSWLYLVDSNGHLLHRSEGHPPQFGMYSIAGYFEDMTEQALPKIYDWTVEEP
ncbi:MAG: hypothetical protein R8G01_08905 [Ilumatobacteraceae bacterium]|nr:hypothetical protein [Ilumatobacteraceae bacterium]